MQPDSSWKTRPAELRARKGHVGPAAALHPASIVAYGPAPPRLTHLGPQTCEKWGHRALDMTRWCSGYWQQSTWGDDIPFGHPWCHPGLPAGRSSLSFTVGIETMTLNSPCNKPGPGTKSTPYHILIQNAPLLRLVLCEPPSTNTQRPLPQFPIYEIEVTALPCPPGTPATS